MLGYPEIPALLLGHYTCVSSWNYISSQSILAPLLGTLRVPLQINVENIFPLIILVHRIYMNAPSGTYYVFDILGLTKKYIYAE